jgi:hypothetical protein
MTNHLKEQTAMLAASVTRTSGPSTPRTREPARRHRTPLLPFCGQKTTNCPMKTRRNSGDARP